MLRCLFKEGLGQSGDELQELDKGKVVILEVTIGGLIYYCHFAGVEGDSDHIVGDGL